MAVDAQVQFSIDLNSIKTLRFGVAEQRQENLEAIKQLLSTVIESDFRTLNVSNPLDVIYRGEPLESFRNKDISITTLPRFSEEGNRSLLYFTDVAVFLYQIREWLQPLDPTNRFNTLDQESLFTTIKALGQQVVVRSSPPDPNLVNDTELATRHKPELATAAQVLLDVVLQMLGEEKSEEAEVQLISLGTLIRSIALQPASVLSYWPKSIFPLATNFKANTLGATNTSLLNTEIPDTSHTPTDKTSNVEVRQALHLFVVALRQFKEHPEWFNDPKISSLSDILTDAEINTLESEDIFFPAEPDLVQVLTAEKNTYREVDFIKISNFLGFFLDQKVAARLIAKTSRTQASTGTGTSEVEDSGGGEDQAPATPSDGSSLTPEELEIIIRQRAETYILSEVFGIEIVTDIPVPSYYQQELQTKIANAVSQELASVFEYFGSASQNDQVPGVEAKLDDKQNITYLVNSQFYSWLETQFSTGLSQWIENNRTKLENEVASAKLTQLAEADQETAPRIASLDQRFDARVLLNQLYSWNRDDVILTAENRLITEGRIYRRESVRLQVILLNQLFSFYGIPEREITPALRSAVAEEIEYALRGLSPEKTALLELPSFKIRLIRQIFLKISVNPIVQINLQSIIDKVGNSKLYESINTQSTSLDNWITGELARNFTFDNEDAALLMQLAKANMLNLSFSSEAGLQEILSRLIGDSDVAATHASTLLQLIDQQGIQYKSDISSDELLNLLRRVNAESYYSQLTQEQRKLVLDQFQRYLTRRQNYLQQSIITFGDGSGVISRIALEWFETDPTNTAHVQSFINIIDSLILQKKSPNFLYTLNQDRLQLIFGFHLRKGKKLDRELLEYLLEYWKLRALKLDSQLQTNVIAGSWEDLNEEKAKEQSNLGIDPTFRRVTFVTFKLAEDIQKDGNIVVARALALSESDLGRQNLQPELLLRSAYLRNLKKNLALEAQRSLGDGAILALNTNAPKGTKSLLKNVANHYANPFKFTQERRLLGGIIPSPTDLSKTAGLMTAANIANAVLPGAGVVLGAVDNFFKAAGFGVGLIFGKQAGKFVENLPFLLSAAAILSGLLAALVGVLSAVVTISNFLSKIAPNLFSGGSSMVDSLMRLGGEKLAGSNSTVAAKTATTTTTTTGTLGWSSTALTLTGVGGSVVLYSTMIINNAAFLDPFDIDILAGETAKLAIVKNASPSQGVTANQTINYTLTVVANVEEGQMSNITVTDTLDSDAINPDSIQITSSGTATCNRDSFTITCTIPELNPGDEVVIEYSAQTVSDSSKVTADGKTPISNQANVTGTLTIDGLAESVGDDVSRTVNGDGDEIVAQSLQIVEGLQRGWWGYYNYHTSYPELFDYLTWNGFGVSGPPCPFPENGQCPRYDGGAPRAMFWCTWNIIYAYENAGRSIANPASPGQMTGVTGMRAYFQSNGEYMDNPLASDLQPGDVLFFGKNLDGGYDRDAHVAIVESVSASTVTTLDSNNYQIRINYTVNTDGTIDNFGAVDPNGRGRL